MVSFGKVDEIIVLSTVIERDFFEKLVYFVFYLYKGNKFCLCWNYIPSQAWKFFRRKTKFWHLVILIFYNTALVHRITYDIIWYFFIVTISTLFTEFQATTAQHCQYNVRQKDLLILTIHNCLKFPDHPLVSRYLRRT